MENLWKKFLELSKAKFPSTVLETWILPMGLAEMGENSITLTAPNDFFRDWIYENYLDQIKEIFTELLEKEIEVLVKTKKKEEVKKLDTRIYHPKLVQKYTFENFIRGRSNEFAYAASQAVVDNLGNLYNPLLIYSNVGLGKTHLITAIGHEVYRKYSDKKILYYRSVDFMNELITCIRFQRMHEFREKFKEADLLLIDDIQFIAGKDTTQEEFFNTFNMLYEKKKQIVITSDKFPRQIPNIEDRLKNRFEWGLTVDIQPPEYETRIAILKSKAMLHNVNLPDEIAHFIAEHICNNIREMEGALIKILAYASLTKSPLTIDIAKSQLADFIQSNNGIITIESIQKTVADYFKIKVSDLKSQKKLKNIAVPRQIAIYLARKHTNLSLSEIGQKFGGKDHSTVIHSINKITKKIEEDSELKKHIEIINSMLTKY